MFLMAWVVNDKIVEIIPQKIREHVERGRSGDGSRIVDITDHQWHKVGDYWGDDPAKQLKPPVGHPLAHLFKDQDKPVG